MYLARRRAERLVAERFGERAEDFYVTSLSCRTICYKGMFMAWQLFGYYPDLADERVVSALAIARVLEADPEWLFDDSKGWPPPHSLNRFEELSEEQLLTIADLILRRLLEMLSEKRRSGPPKDPGLPQ